MTSIEPLVGEQDLAVRAAHGSGAVRDEDARVVFTVDSDDAEPLALLLDAGEYRFVVGRCLDQLGLDHQLVRRWGQE